MLARILTGASRSLASPIVTTTVVRSLSEAASGGVLTGKVKGFDQRKGWGFITPDNGAADVFVHQTEVRRSGYRFLKVGEEVEFVLDETDGRKAKNVTGPGGDLLPARQPRLQFRDTRSPGGYGDDRPRRPRYNRSYEGEDSSYGDRPRGRSSPRQARGDDEYAEDMSYDEKPQRRAQGGYIKEDQYDDKEYDRDLGKPTEEEYRHVKHEQTLAQDAVEQDHKSHAK